MNKKKSKPKLKCPQCGGRLQFWHGYAVVCENVKFKNKKVAKNSSCDYYMTIE